MSCPKLISKGRTCIGCRVRRCRGAVVEGACCRAPDCGIADERMLRRHRFVDGVAIVCANHSAVAGRRELTWADFETELRAPLRRAG
jgi:hypothetical protein